MKSAVPPPGTLKSLVRLVLPQLPLSTLYTQFRLRSLKPDLPWLPFALRLNLSSSTVSLKLLALVSPCFITPSPCLRSNYGPLDSSLLVLLTVFLPVDICSHSFLLLPFPPSPPVQPCPSFCPALLAWPPISPALGHLPCSSTRPNPFVGLQDSTLSLSATNQIGVLSPRGHSKDFGGLSSPPSQSSSHLPPRTPQINVI